jgi:glycosyltransferase involved in cell wall biosynthesis
LETPDAFRSEAGSAPIFTRLRCIDAWRFRNDPWLRASYAGAAAVLGVAPYVQDVLSEVPLQRFETTLELGIDALAPEVVRAAPDGQLKLLHVGRGVRTKGLRDAVRALAHLKDHPGVTLTSAGAGEEIDLARAEALELGVADQVTFLGRIPREQVEDLYRSHDVFCFPSFREPAGGVLNEAMRWGLPIITAARGGPDWIVDDSCGLRVPVTTPSEFARDIAQAIRTLARDSATRHALGQAARRKVALEGFWSMKADNLIGLYRELAPARKAQQGKQKVSAVTLRA